MYLPSNLDVPLEYQEDDFSCVPICIKMVIDYVRRENPTGYVPNIDVEEVRKTMLTDELGTSLENVERINKKLEKAVPSIEFTPEVNCVFDEIENEILHGKPVIAWIKMPHAHSVVVTGLNKELLIVYCNDPELEKTEVQMGKFISAWNKRDNVLIKVKIGEKIQRIIPEYTEEDEQRREEL